jgi:hypothetical protein
MARKAKNVLISLFSLYWESDQRVLWEKASQKYKVSLWAGEGKVHTDGLNSSGSLGSQKIFGRFIQDTIFNKIRRALWSLTCLKSTRWGTLWYEGSQRCHSLNHCCWKAKRFSKGENFLPCRRPRTRKNNHSQINCYRFGKKIL